MKSIILLIGLIINAFIFVNQPIEEPSTIKGMVLNGKEKVENAVVQLTNNCNDQVMEITTQKDGAFQFLNLPSRCCYTVQVKKTGFITVQLEEICMDNTGKQPTPIIIQLTPKPTSDSIKIAYETITQTIEVSPATTKWTKKKSDKNGLSANPDDNLVWTLEEQPAKYAKVTKTVPKGTVTPSKPVMERIEVIPAEYETITEQVITKVASTRLITVPAEYETVTDRIEVSPGNFKTVEKQVLKSPATTKTITTPTQYKTVTKNVVKTPATTRSINNKPKPITKQNNSVFSKPKRKSTLKAGQLTAGEMNDFSKWDLWQDISKDQLNRWQKHWKMTLERRYTVQVTNKKGMPIIDGKVRLLTADKLLIWQGKTDNTGKAELWLNVFNENNTADGLLIEVTHHDKAHKIKKTTPFQEGINTLKIKADCDLPNQVDIAFVVDGTGSMTDELRYLQAELSDVIGRMKKENKALSLNVGSVFYKDHGCSYLTKKSNFSENIEETIDFIKAQQTETNSTTAELVHDGLSVAIDEMKWSKKAVARLLFLVLDAPPHYTPEVLQNIQYLTRKAAKKGIRIIPIACSGTDKSTEYLMRSFALATNGTYVHLTDDSGIGNKHITPTGAKSKVEKLNDLLVRLFHQYTAMPTCEDEQDFVLENEEEEKEGINSSLIVKAYPNPTKGNLHLDLENPLTEIFITDYSGKIILRRLNLPTGKTTIDLSRFPSGVYFLSYFDGKERGSRKIVVVR